MRVSGVAKKYAKSLFESAGGALPQVLNELKQFSKAFESDPALFAFFANPVIAMDVKLKVLEPISKNLNPTTFGFLKTIIANSRVQSLSGVLAGAQFLIDEQNQVSRGSVSSAQPLSDDMKKRLEDKIHSVVKKKIELSYEIKPGLLGGVTAQVGGWTFDDTIDSQLNKLKDELNRSAN